MLSSLSSPAPDSLPEPRRRHLFAYVDWLALLNSSERDASVRVVSEPGSVRPRIAEAAGCTLLFSGALAKDVLNDDGALPGDEDRVLTAYLRQGTALFPRLRGRFVLVLLDRRDGVSYVLRDPMGAHPLFYAAAGATLYVSPSAETVARRDGQKPELNRVTAAAFLLRTSLDGEETFFVGVRRLLQGHVIEARGDRIQIGRYWLPHNGEALPDGVDGFHALLRQAVDRLVDGRTGVFLSGGLDSALVAAVLADLARSRGLPPPVALSLAFRGTDADEEPMQREVASRLGLEHVVHTPKELVGSGGLLDATLELSRSSTSRPPELLAPAYDELARLGSSRGCTTILDGAGGDEWLLPPPAYAADRVVSFDALALVQLCRAWAGYWPGVQPLSAVRGVLWRSGLRSASRSLFGSVAGRFAPALPMQIRRARAEQRIPSWIAPEEDLRRRLLAATLVQTTPDSPRAAVDAQKRVLLDSGNLSIAQELAFELQARAATASLSPLLDPDVVELLYRLPPRQLIAGGRAKAPARHVLSRYLADLANSWPRTVYANSLWTETIRTEGSRAWSASAGASVVAEHGLADPERLGAILTGGASPVSPFDLNVAWRALSLDAWLGGIDDRLRRV
jgi:asparagine synthetase B (glutamine-hydrolysing)